jgi:putative lipoic acid-binding regulatory protein
VETSRLRNDFRSGSEIQVIGVGQDDLETDLLQVVPRYGFDRGVCPTGMNTGVVTCVGRLRIPVRAAVRVEGLQKKIGVCAIVFLLPMLGLAVATRAVNA